ncbi:DUF1883 domain-containing protein [Sinorhizobium fredii]|nr:DUF1883 domain-containing protein [Sinorhizobium fredii]KSV80591.1 hypothetical protein N181_06380 [Sinorhizobium fredii USDA 205]MCG5477202.1 DUF1883 domain-containing protein [Sinorhizobium fredii]MQW96189.1 DUF1883 domain-containing protein [Sinorhizobium fredii]MQX11148.1 DUF1883 domain-containing protein [Sinorhizobium fredii]UTY49019.1 DUF1883 domain-containing protein [Sinorhizobium fredii]
MAKQALNYTHYDLKGQKAGTRIEITLSAVANVRLMTDVNFTRYTETLKHQFFGGVARKSPLRMTIPETAHWHLVIDTEGHHGLAESSVRVIESAGQPRFQPAS